MQNSKGPVSLKNILLFSNASSTCCSLYLQMALEACSWKRHPISVSMLCKEPGIRSGRPLARTRRHCLWTQKTCARPSEISQPPLPSDVLLLRRGKLMNRRKCLLKNTDRKYSPSLGAVSLEIRIWNQKRPWKVQLASSKFGGLKTWYPMTCYV